MEVGALNPAYGPSLSWHLLDDNPHEWKWGRRARCRHDLSTWLPVAGPGSVQETLWRAGRIPHPYRDLQSRAAEWVEHRDWIYGWDFTLPPLAAGQRIFLECESVAGRCAVCLNGTPLGGHEGPGAPLVRELGPGLQDGANQLLLVIQAPSRADPQIGWTEYTRSLQGRMGYGWDFAPRLVRLGILGRTGLRQTGAHRLHDLWACPAVDGSLARATVTLKVGVDGPPGAHVRFEILRGTSVLGAADVVSGADGVARSALDLSRAYLWRPNGLGRQPLYQARATCVDGSDSLTSTFGLRRLRWVERPDGQPDE